MPITFPKASPFRAIAVLTAVVMLVALPSVPASASAPDSPFRGQKLYVDPNTKPAVLARNPSSPNLGVLRYIARTPQAYWVVDLERVRPIVRPVLADVRKKKAYPLFVVYALPYRDCGGYSGGGTTAAKYRAGIKQFAALLKGRKAAVLLEPDGLAASNCLSKAKRKQRIALVRYAVRTLAKNPRVSVYIDMGNSKWRPPAQAAALLRQAGVAYARGFSLNVANFQRTKAETRYGKAISRRIGNKPFIIDTSRNGRGSLPMSVHEFWCNPKGRAIGVRPTARTSSPLVDAYVWVKRPGESDGPCKGGGPSGSWYHARAVELVKNRMADLRK